MLINNKSLIKTINKLNLTDDEREKFNKISEDDKGNFVYNGKSIIGGATPEQANQISTNKTNIATLKELVGDSSSGLVKAVTDNASQLDTIENNIDNYKEYVVDDDWQPAIQRALSEKGRVTLNDREYIIKNEIVLTNNNTITGRDKSKTFIKLADNSNCKMVVYDNNTTNNTSISNITFNGNRANQTSNNNVLELINDFNETDYAHFLTNVNVIESSGSGIVFEGRTGGSIFTNVDVQRVNVDGISLRCYDSAFICCSVGHAKDGTAMIIDGANNRLTNCKGWGSLNGIDIKGLRNLFSVIESQDNGVYGIKIDGSMNILKGVLCDSIGYRYRAGQGIFEPNATSIKVNGYDNTVDGLCIDRKQFSITGSQCYALECNGMRNKINLLARELINDAIKGTPNKTNQIEFISALNKDNSRNTPSRFVNEVNGIVNGNGFVITGDSDLSVILPVINNEKQWTKTLEYNPSKDTYQFGTHVIPKGWSLDLGQQNNKWKSVWIREYLNIKNDENTSEIVIGENVILNKKSSLYIRGGESTTGIIVESDTNTIKGHSNASWNLGSETNKFLNLYLVNPPSVSSQREMKENIKKFDDNIAYNSIKDIPIYTYNYKKYDNDGNYVGIDSENMLGSIIDELPIECINEKAHGVDLYAYTSYCISALKKAIEKIEILEKEINFLKQ